MRLRETRSRFKKSVKLWGVEHAVFPLVVSGLLSVVLIIKASSTANWFYIGLATMPFVLTFLYLLIFVTNRRPHFARDVYAMAWPGAKSLPTRSSKERPKHPSLERATRARR